LCDFGDFEQNRFDFGQFDAIAAQLHLGVDAPEIFNLAVLVDAAEIAGAIDAARRIVGEGQKIWDELRRIQFGPIEIALGDANAGDADFACGAQLDRLVAQGIENDDRIRRQRPADGDRLFRAQAPQGRGHRGFRRAVTIEQAAAGPTPALDQGGRAGFAADQQNVQLRQIAIHRGEQRRHAAKAGHAARFEKIGELLAEQARRRRVGNDRRAGGQGNPQLLDREIEGHRHALIDPLARAKAIELARDAHEIADARMRDGDALGLAGRARCIEDIAERVGGRSAFVLAQGPVVQRGELVARFVENELGNSAVGEEIGEPEVRSDGVGEDVSNAFGRIIDVKRNVNRPRLQ